MWIYEKRYEVATKWNSSVILAYIRAFRERKSSFQFSETSSQRHKKHKACKVGSCTCLVGRILRWAKALYSVSCSISGKIILWGLVIAEVPLSFLLVPASWDVSGSFLFLFLGVIEIWVGIEKELIFKKWVSFWMLKR